MSKHDKQMIKNVSKSSNVENVNKCCKIKKEKKQKFNSKKNEVRCRQDSDFICFFSFCFLSFFDRFYLCYPSFLNFLISLHFSSFFLYVLLCFFFFPHFSNHTKTRDNL